jgi:hypothetical protein
LLIQILCSVVVCSIARLPYVIALGYTADTTYTEAILGVWTIVEVNLGIFCACAMRLKPLFVKYFPQLNIFSSRSTSKTSGIRWGKGTMERSRGQHSYQLHSYQKGSVDPVLDSHGNHSYKVDVQG